MDKILVIVLVVGGLLVAGLSGTAYILKQKLDTAHSEKVRLEGEKKTLEDHLAAAQGDLERSEFNHNRIVAEKDVLLDVYMDRAIDQTERANQFARINKDIANAPQSYACADSPAVDAALDGLRALREAAGIQGRLPADNRIPAGENPGEIPILPRPAANPRSQASP